MDVSRHKLIIDCKLQEDEANSCEEPGYTWKSRVKIASVRMMTTIDRAVLTGTQFRTTGPVMIEDT